MNKILSDEDIALLKAAKKLLKKINKLAAKDDTVRAKIEKQAKISWDPDSIYFI